MAIVKDGTSRTKAPPRPKGATAAPRVPASAATRRAELEEIGREVAQAEQRVRDLEREEYARTEYPKFLWKYHAPETGRREEVARRTGLAQPSHPYYPYADEAWQYPGWEERLRTIQRERAKEAAEGGRYREAGLAPPRTIPPRSLAELLSGFRPFQALERRLPPITEAIRRAQGLSNVVRDFPYVPGERQIDFPAVRADERARMLEEYPWSDYGKAVIQKTVMGRMLPVERRIKGGGYAITHPGTLGVIRLGYGGEVVPHEIAHAAQFLFPLWEEIKDEFPGALKDWLESESKEEWDEQKRYVFNTWVRRERIQRGHGDMEVYAHLAQTPWLIPPELEQFFPQYDLRSRGPTARPGYRGPTYPSFWPPPPVTGPRLK